MPQSDKNCGINLFYNLTITYTPKKKGTDLKPQHIKNNLFLTRRQVTQKIDLTHFFVDCVLINKSVCDMYRQRDKELTGGIILDETLQEILLVRGARSKKLGLPKGHVEPGESYLEGALREIWEEVGLKIELAISVLPCILTLRAKLFLMAIKKDRCKLCIKDTNEIEEIGWYPINKLHLLEEDATMMLKDLRQRMPHILEKIKANIDNYSLEERPGGPSKKVYLNEYLHGYINPHLDKSVDHIIEIVKRKFANLFYQPELKSAIEALKTKKSSSMGSLYNWTVGKGEHPFFLLGKNVTHKKVFKMMFSPIALGSRMPIMC